MRDAALSERVRTASRAAFGRLVDTAIAEAVAGLLISGDLFDGAERSAQTAAFLTLQLERLRDHGIKVFCIKGNHDAENPLTGDVAMPDNVHVFDGRGGKVQLADGVWIHGVSFANRHAPESLLPKFQAPVAGAVNIAMLHTSLAGAEGHDPYAPCTVEQLTSMGFDYWALGHVHRRQIHAEVPWVVMPGMLQGRDMGEPGPKSATLITLGETISAVEVPTSVVEFLRLSVDATGSDSDDTLRDRMRHLLRKTASDLTSESAVVRLSVTGRSPRRWQMARDRDVWVEAATAYARATGRLWLEKLVFDLSDDEARGPSATDELATIMQAVRGEPGFAAACRAEIEDILKELPPARRAALLPDEGALDRLADRLATEGAERVLARVKGAGS